MATNAARVAIDARNLHIGGGVQVAASFIDEICSADVRTRLRYPWLDSLSIHVSAAVSDNSSQRYRNRLRVENRSPIGALADLRRRTLADVCFYPFGPAYGKLGGAVNVMGFADGTLLHHGYQAKHGKSNLKTHIRRHLATKSFLTAEQLIVETEACRQLLVHTWKVAPARIHVVPNAPNAVFFSTESRAEPWNLTKIRPISMLYAARLYPHKNHAFLGELGQELALLGWQVQFQLTLNAAEWQALPPLARRYSINLGVLQVRDLPEAYARADAVIFPSLLETFSVTPLEALVSGKPLFASDRDFVRDSAGDSAFYIDPTHAVAAAQAIAEALASPSHIDEHVARGLAIAQKLPTAHDRAMRYLEIIDKLLRAEEFVLPCE